MIEIVVVKENKAWIPDCRNTVRTHRIPPPTPQHLWTHLVAFSCANQWAKSRQKLHTIRNHHLSWSAHVTMQPVHCTISNINIRAFEYPSSSDFSHLQICQHAHWPLQVDQVDDCTRRREWWQAHCLKGNQAVPIFTLWICRSSFHKIRSVVERRNRDNGS